MKKTRVILTILIWAACTTFAFGQNFLNGDLIGPITGVSCLPINWQNVPYTDVNCLATIVGQDTPDLTNSSGPDASMGLLGNPFSGSTFVSGLHAGNSGSYWQEGIMQHVSGFSIGQNYTIRFHQAVVKQLNALDESGSWAVYIDTVLAGITNVTQSSAPYNSTSFTWEARNIIFTATASSHLVKFLPIDDDANTTIDTVDITGALRMGIDSISLNFATGIENQNNSKSFSIYPNPFDQYTTVQFNNAKKEICTLVLYNLHGQIERTITNITSDQVLVEKKDLPVGLHYFVLRTSYRVIATGKLAVD